MNLEQQRAAVMAKHKELKAQRELINKQINENLEFFRNKPVLIRHARGLFEAIVVGAYHDDYLTVMNVKTNNKSTRLLHDVAAMAEDEEYQD